MHDDHQHFAVLCQIHRAQHFAWREAVAALGADAAACVDRMWEVTGRQTARAYRGRLDAAQPLPSQVAACVAWSSRAMGEDASVELPIGEDGGAALVRHRSCPWLDWHRRMGLLAEDRRGCDLWFQSLTAELNRLLGSRLHCETLAALPDGDDCCLRRFTQEP